MKTYLHFSTEGEVTEIKTNDKLFNSDSYKDYTYIENITHNSNNFIILFNKNTNEKKNITSLPFYNKELFGNFILFIIDNQNNIKSLTENKFLKFINVSKKNINDYSSDDFNLSD
tara:strand:+ start:169 stop:513 length:345 start_codon:yes stop_codon:yes gene_type:complete